jgi:hypothetical protein
MTVNPITVVEELDRQLPAYREDCEGQPWR